MTDQPREPDLFDYVPPPPPPRPETEQDRHLARVSGKIAESVLDFIRSRGVGAQFHAQDLHDHVGREVAPASADRILRHLRREEVIDYEIINRRASLYEITAIGEGT